MVIFALNVIARKIFVMVIIHREHSAYSAEPAKKSGHPNSKQKEKSSPQSELKLFHWLYRSRGAVQNRNCMFFSVSTPIAVVFFISPQILLRMSAVKRYGITGAGIVSLICTIVIS